MADGASAAAPAPPPVDPKAKERFASGMVALLEPIVRECDERSQAVLKAQGGLAQQLELFSAEMAKLQGVDPSPHLAPYADKLVGSRKKIRRVEMMVEQTRERVANIARMHTALLATEKAQKERMQGLNGSASRPDFDPPVPAPPKEEAAPASEKKEGGGEGAAASGAAAADGKGQEDQGKGDATAPPETE